MNEQAAKKPPEPVLPEPPIELIQQLAANMPFVALNLRRRNGRGGMGFVCAMTCSTTDLADGTLENTLNGEYGGGEFQVRAMNPDNKMEAVLPTYSTSVDGVPKVGTPGAPTGTSPREQRQQRLNSPALQHAVPVGVLPGQPFFQPSHLAPPPVPEGRSFMQRLPDEIASEQTDYLRVELEKLTSKFEQQHRESIVQIETLRGENNRLRLEQRDREIAHEKALHEARFRDLELKLAAPAKSPIDVTAIVGFVTALVPVFTAMISASKDRAALVVSQQTEASKMQMEGIKTMVAMQEKKKPDFDLPELIKLGTPLVTAFISGRDPGKMAELMQTMGENQLGLLSMVGTMVNNMAGESEHPMMRIAQEAIAGAINVAEKMAQSREQAQRQQQAPQPPPQQLSPPPRQMPAAAATPRRRVGGAPAPAPQVVEAPTSPDELARMMLADPGWPAAMRGPAWQVIMRDVHDPAAPVGATALALGQALDALYDAGRLPPQLGGIFEDGTPEDLQREAAAFFDALPVREDRERSTALTAALVDVFTPHPDDAPAEVAASANGADHSDDGDGADDADADGADDDGVIPADA